MSSSGQCVPCQCNNRSTDCNPVTGECLVCFTPVVTNIVEYVAF